MRLLALVSGFTAVALGAVFLPLPTPFGVPLLALGGGLLLVASPALRHRFRLWRGRHRSSSDRIMAVEPYLPAAVRAALVETHPDEAPATDPARVASASPTYGSPTHGEGSPL